MGKYKVQIQKIFETADMTNGVEAEMTGIVYNIIERGEQYHIYAPGHNLKPNQIKKAIKDHLKTLPPKPELEGSIIDVDTEEEE